MRWRRCAQSPAAPPRAPPSHPPPSLSVQPTLNAFMALGRPAWRAVRARLQSLFAAEGEVGADSSLRSNAALRAVVLRDVTTVAMQLPATVGDYTDFYSSRDHAHNVGVMIRGPANALQPNWTWLPVGYHGRASSIVVSGTPFKRPCGQQQTDPADPSKGAVYGPSKRMDFELEVGTWIGKGNALGDAIPLGETEEHMFGMCLMNDWSARDIQTWEYVPLGPFGSKNFCTTVSPWVITLDALEPFRCATSTGAQDPAPLPYLVDPAYGSWDVELEVSIAPGGEGVGHVITRSNYKHMYWNVRQQLAHHTVTGCNMRPGDLLGSGTVSGPVSSGPRGRAGAPAAAALTPFPPLPSLPRRPPTAAAASWSCRGRARSPWRWGRAASPESSSRTGTPSSCAGGRRTPSRGRGSASAPARGACWPRRPRRKKPGDYSPGDWVPEAYASPLHQTLRRVTPEAPQA
jgi:fumarylacetoacetase